MFDITDYIQKVDSAYDKCKLSGLFGDSIDWGVFSGKINRLLRAESKCWMKGHPFRSRLSYAFIYWTLKNRLLELRRSKGIFREIRKIQYQSRLFKEMAIGESKYLQNRSVHTGY